MRGVRERASRTASRRVAKRKAPSVDQRSRTGAPGHSRGVEDEASKLANSSPTQTYFPYACRSAFRAVVPCTSDGRKEGKSAAVCGGAEAWLLLCMDSPDAARPRRRPSRKRSSETAEREALCAASEDSRTSDFVRLRPRRPRAAEKAEGFSRQQTEHNYASQWFFQRRKTAPSSVCTVRASGHSERFALAVSSSVGPPPKLYVHSTPRKTHSLLGASTYGGKPEPAPSKAARLPDTRE